MHNPIENSDEALGFIIDCQRSWRVSAVAIMDPDVTDDTALISNRLSPEAVQQ